MKGLKEDGKWQYFIDGEEVSREIYEETFPDKPMAKNGQCSLRGWSKPILSDALAVHPSQIPEVMERNKKAGLPPIEYESTYGRPILTSREMRRKLMKVSKVHDNQGGYGDDHHVAEKKPASDPAIDSACKFLDSIPVKGF